MIPNRLSELYGGMMLAEAHARAQRTPPRSPPSRTAPARSSVTEWVEERAAGARGEPDLLARRGQRRKITVRPILEDAARVAALQTGEVDFIANVPYERIAELQARPEAGRSRRSPTPRVFFVAIDPRVPPFDNVKVRQALNYAVDVDAIISALYLGHATRLATVVPTAASATTRASRPTRTIPTRPSQLLAEAGYPERLPDRVRLLHRQRGRALEAGRGDRRYLQQVGLDVKLNVFEFGAFGRAGWRTRSRRSTSTASATSTSSQPGRSSG